MKRASSAAVLLISLSGNFVGVTLPANASAAEEDGATSAVVIEPTVLPDELADTGTGSLEDIAIEQDVTAAQAACSFTQHADNPHISSTAFEASGHGYWTTTNTARCQARTATVSVQLQQYWSDGRYRNAGAKAQKSGVLPGGGSGRRATGRARCFTAKAVTWRSLVDVDIEGYVDGSAVAVSRRRTLSCRY